MTDPSTEVRRQHPAGIFLRGIAMGAADIVPGVSGGTIAFITGIYFRLLQAINAMPAAFFRDFCRGRFREFWRSSDAGFLVTLLAGILLSVFSLASIITYALEHYAIPLWSFFFGLIVGSVWHVFREVRQLQLRLLFPLVVGMVFAWWITTLTVGQVSPTMLNVFFAGALAICAMILPGVSGSFILVVLGMYAHVLDAIRGVELTTLALFGAGCVTGLLSIARALAWGMQRFHDAMLALLTGFMIGALNRVWPWKETLSWRINSSGHSVPVEEVNVWPAQYGEITGGSPELLSAILAAIFGLALVFVIERFAMSFEARRN